MATKACPTCNRSNDSDLRVCRCGYVFLPEGSADRDTGAYAPVRFGLIGNYKVKRILGLLPILILSAVGVWTFFTYYGDPADDTDEDGSANSISRAENPTNLVSSPTAKNLLEGVVTRVITGDAINVRDRNNVEHQVRLFAIAAPKLNDTFGKEAKESLSAAILGKSVRVISVKIEENGVVIGRVIKDDLNVGLEQVRKGDAAHNSSVEQTQEERKLFADTEALAKNGRLGLWAASEQPAGLPGDSEIASVNEPKTLSSSTGKPSVPTGQQSNRVTQEQPQLRIATPKPAAPPPIAIVPLPSPVSEPPTARIIPAAPPVELKTAMGPTASDPGSARKYIRGPRGGCYYLNSKGSKSYVDHSLCP